MVMQVKKVRSRSSQAKPKVVVGKVGHRYVKIMDGFSFSWSTGWKLYIPAKMHPLPKFGRDKNNELSQFV